MNGYKKNNEKTRVEGRSFLHRVYDCLEPYLVWNTLWILLFCVGLGYFLIAMPKGLDDYWFLEKFCPWLTEHGYMFPENGVNLFKTGMPWTEIIETWKYRTSYDNARLGNLLVMFFLLLPKWVGSGLAFLSWLYVMYGSIRLTGIDWRKSPLIPVALFLWTFFIPWRNGMSTLVYQFNYVLPSALGVFLLVRLFRKPKLKRGKLKLCGLFAVAFLTGWWHEGFSVPILAGLAAVMVLFGKCRTKSFYCVCLGLLAGLSVMMFAPSMHTRIHIVVSGKELISISRLYEFCVNILYVVFVCLTVFSFRKLKSGIMRGKNTLLIFMLVSGFIPILIMIRTYSESRVSWWSHCMSVVGIIMLLRYCYDRIWMSYKLKSMAVASVCIVLFILHLGYNSYYVMLNRKDLLGAEAAYTVNPGEAYFGNVKTCSFLPLIMLNMPDAFAYTTTPLIINMYLKDGEKPFCMIPKELEYVTEETGRILSGGSGQVKEYKGRLYMAAPLGEQETPMQSQLLADYGFGYRQYKVFYYPYISKADGRRYYWLYICGNWIVQHFGEIRGVRWCNDFDWYN